MGNVRILLEFAVMFLGILAVRGGLAEGSFLICACNTAECQGQETDRCIATNMCFAQSEHQSGHGPAEVIRGCINRSTPLLCENRPPASVVLTGRAWPLLHCCSSDMCNQDVSPTPPPWFPMSQTTESPVPEPELLLRPKLSRKSNPRRKSNKPRKPAPMTWPTFPLVPSASAVPNKTDLSELDQPYPRPIPRFPTEDLELRKAESEREPINEDTISALFGTEPVPVEIESDQDQEALLTENIPVAIIRETESSVVRKQSVSVEEVSSESEPNWNLLYVVIPGVGVVGLLVALCLLIFIIRRGRYLSTEDLLPVTSLAKSSYDKGEKRSSVFQSASKPLIQKQLEPLQIVKVVHGKSSGRNSRVVSERAANDDSNSFRLSSSMQQQQNVWQSSAWMNPPVQDNRGFTDRDGYPKTRSEPGVGFSHQKSYRISSSAASDCARFPSF